MRACPSCGDLSSPLAIRCETCGAALVPVAVGLTELRALRSKTPKTGPIVRCEYCGKRRRGYCGEHGDLARLERDLFDQAVSRARELEAVSPHKEKALSDA
jgi:hypothetical protein